MKGSVTIKRTQLLNMIQNNRLIFLSKVSEGSKRFAWGRQTAFQDVLEEDLSGYDHDEFMQKKTLMLPRHWVAKGLDFVLRKDEI